MPKLKTGNIAPGLELLDQNGKKHKLSTYKGEWLLIYFYPKDDTPGCTKEACAIRDDFPRFQKLKLKVFGISVDSVASHKKFTEKYHLPFTLLADPEKKAVKSYGVWVKKEFMGKEYIGTARTSFLINPSGKIAKIYEKVDPASHADEVIGDLKKLISA